MYAIEVEGIQSTKKDTYLPSVKSFTAVRILRFLSVLCRNLLTSLEVFVVTNHCRLQGTDVILLSLV